MQVHRKREPILVFSIRLPRGSLYSYAMGVAFSSLSKLSQPTRAIALGEISKKTNPIDRRVWVVGTHVRRENTQNKNALIGARENLEAQGRRQREIERPAKK